MSKDEVIAEIKRLAEDAVSVRPFDGMHEAECRREADALVARFKSSQIMAYLEEFGATDEQIEELEDDFYGHLWVDDFTNDEKVISRFRDDFNEVAAAYSNHFWKLFRERFGARHC